MSTYVEIDRQWRNGDTVEVSLPKTLRFESLPDNPRRGSLLWGPLVLAGDLGPEVERGRGGEQPRPEPPVVPVFVAGGRPVSDWLKPVAGAPGSFRSAGAGREPDQEGGARDVDFVPMYRLHRHTYSTYWDLFTPEEWDEEKTGYAAEAERMRRLEAASVAYLQPGEAVFDRPFNFQGEDTQPQRIHGRPGRRGSGWFSYDVPVEPDHPMVMILTYYSNDRRGTPASFEVLVDGNVVAAPDIGRSEPPRFFDVEYPIPASFVAGNDTVNIRFSADEGSQIATIFGLRMIRGDARR